jgi:diguanylate cyclase (GGDEF)-like protein/PAS domain S-box-containing protein
MTHDAKLDPWRLVVEMLPDGAALTDARLPDQPLVYVNPALERITGYAASELLGRNLSLLHGDMVNQPGLRRLRDAIGAGMETRARVQNFRKNGEAFWMDVHVVPCRDADGSVAHWVSVHREAEVRETIEDRSTGRFRAIAPELLLRQDPVTGLRGREAFDELLEHQVAVSARDKHALTLFLVAVDDLDGYVSTFDRAAGDALLRRVSVALGACFRRRSDALCRFDDSGFAVLSGGMDERQASEHGRTLCARVADLRIHHPRSRFRRYVTLSVGVVNGIPPADGNLASVLDQAGRALAAARQDGDTARFAPLTPG